MEKASGTIETLIGRHPRARQKMSTAPKKGRVATTHWKVVEEFPGVTLLEVTLETGRTHQVRVHLSSVGHPVVGDSLYGSAKRLKESMQAVRDTLRSVSRPLLHAGYLKFIHPISAAAVDFTVPLPDDFISLLPRLRSALC
jgi:23S rRNA pseudouridine1911/1915/1917 synthase